MPSKTNPARQERLKFFAALGRAVAEWGFIEFALQLAFAKLLTNDADSLVSAASYFAVIGLKARLDMVRHAARIRLNKEDYETFTRLADRAEKLGGDRNRLAHYYYSSDPTEPPGERFISEPFYKDPNFYEFMSNGKPKKKKTYTTAQLNELADKFMDLGGDIWEFIADVKLVRTRRPATLRRILPR